MNFSAIDYSQLSIYPKLIRDYLSASVQLKSLYKYPFDFSAFRQVINDKRIALESRHVLAGVLNEQYAGIKTTSAVRRNIEKLKDTNTFTITTAHQPVLFTGPLYVVYKIISAINVAERLCSEYPDRHFVPVYCMGAEDHDFEEINHVWLNGEKLEWKQDKDGAVGRLSTKEILPLIDEVEKRLHGKTFASEAISLLKEAFGSQFTLAKATLHFVDKLFGDYGLVVLIPDNKQLKPLFAPVIEQELLHNHSFKLCEQTNNELNLLGYDVRVNPREINLFYLEEGIRERIVWNLQTTKYEVLNTSLSFTRDEILRLVTVSPERFSPNVMLRPLYQETILPNLAYVGGAGELSYWLQQKKIFDHYSVNFPMLVLRNSALLIDSNTARKIKKAGIELKELFEDEETLIQHFVRRNSNHTLSFDSEREVALGIFEAIREKATAVDPTLAGAIEAQKASFVKGLEGIETKVMRAEKRNFETAVAQIKSVKAKLFPGNVPQERVENFLPWYAQYGGEFFRQLKQHFDPFRKVFLIGQVTDSL
ncbi:MAG TPA: bacillithiol biosynthesis cysteine-adding enzyme BshC [Chitinophagales bacterium]|nr:bacillithiol biosynthesis cysteine-adding enzyme BshC [Chitinophagales bacterium]